VICCLSEFGTLNEKNRLLSRLRTEPVQIMHPGCDVSLDINYES